MMVIELLSISLQGVARAVFNFMFVMIIMILVMIIGKLKDANYYNQDQSKSVVTTTIELATQGTVVGFIASIILIFLGFPVSLSDYLVLLLPISLVLSLSNIRYLCIAHSAGVLAIIAMVLRGQVIGGITLPNIDIEPSGLIALVGVLHVMEGILIVIFGHKDAIPIVSKSDDQIILGHIIHKFWPVPFAALIATTGVLTGEAVDMPTWWPIIGQNMYLMDTVIFMVFPLVGVIGYSTITFSKEPKKRAIQSGSGIGIYGLILIVVAYFGQNQWVFQILGIIMMLGLHELFMRIEIHQDNKNSPLYPVPKRGIRVMHVNETGIGSDMGLALGDVIEKVNGIEVVNLRHFKAIMKQHYKFIKMEVSNIYNEKKQLEYFSAFENRIVLGIKLIPEKPPIIFKVSNLLKIGMVHLMANQKIKR